MLPFARALLFAFAVLPLGGCASRAGGAEAAEPEPLPISIVTSTVVVAACPDAKRMNARQASA